MNSEELSEKVERISYHIKLIRETIDPAQYPVESLVLKMNWGEDDLDNAHDIFEKYDSKLDKNEDISWNDFEVELKKKFKIGYQEVKHIVLAFHDNSQWAQVCYEYAMSFEPTTPIEFHRITRKNSNL